MFVCSQRSLLIPDMYKNEGISDNSDALITIAYQLVCLIKCGGIHMQSICGDTHQCAVVQNDHRISMIRESLEREHGVVGLHDNIAFLRVWKYRICLNQFLWKFIVQTLQQKGSQA